MEIEVKRRNPALGFTTVVVDGTNNVLTEDQYVDIIKSCSRIEGTAANYITLRNQLLTEYFINGPKEQFSW